MAGGTETKIDTVLFASTAEAVGNVAKEMQICFQDWSKIMQSLRANWKGDTSDDIKNTSEAVGHSAEALIHSLEGYKVTLNELAGIYDKTEKNVTESSKTLKFDKTLR